MYQSTPLHNLQNHSWVILTVYEEQEDELLHGVVSIGDIPSQLEAQSLIFTRHLQQFMTHLRTKHSANVILDCCLWQCSQLSHRLPLLSRGAIKWYSTLTCTCDTISSCTSQFMGLILHGLSTVVHRFHVPLSFHVFN